MTKRDPNDARHVYPVRDAETHVLAHPARQPRHDKPDGWCWCEPRVEWIEGMDGVERPLVVHQRAQ